MNIELSDKEAQAVLQILDIATKARGLEVAEACLVLAKRIQDAAKAEQEKPSE